MHGIEQVRESYQSKLVSAKTSDELERIRVEYLGKKGIIADKLKLLSEADPDEKKTLGMEINVLKRLITESLSARKSEIGAEELQRKLKSSSLDITLPGWHTLYGSEHPIHKVLNRIIGIFTSMGFGVEEGPEVELDYFNFEALNMPKGHPARDMQDTFYVSDDVVLRTHTSPVQIRVMKEKTPPLRFIAPGKVYRCDADISHTPMFHQVEGLMVGDEVSFANLKAVLETFIHEYFGPNIPVRFRPSFFPFTEPSAEVDMGCIFCSGSGCRICKTTGWIEILGAGMVNPKVFEMCGYEAGRYTGFAFGMGIERIAILTYSIDDIRIMFENDVRFLRQF